MLELDVGPVAHGGHCVGRYEGRVVFVRHALPGERVRAAVTEEHRRYLRADAVEVLRPSPDRVAPPCPYAGPGRCGGCDWQHAALPAQRALKAAVVREQLRRLAGVDRPVTVEELPGAPGGLGWRTRVRFSVAPDGAAGFRRHRSHEVQPVDRCLIAHPGVEEAGVERRAWPGVAAVEVAAGADGTVVLADGEPVGGRPVVGERAAGREWRVSGGGFWQVHPAAADVLAAAVLGWARPRPGETAWDLYAGVGLFAAGLAAGVGAGGRVAAVESARSAVDDARRNLADLPQVRVVRGRVDAALLGRLPGPPHVVVLDPPRTGAGGAVVRALAAVTRRAVVYVSCDPATLARDVATFGAAGWRLADLRAFDLFPMTAHVESVALLEPS